MRIIYLVLIFQLSTNLLAQSKTNSFAADPLYQKAHALFLSHNLEKLLNCSDDGNSFCSSFLGRIYFLEGKYSLALPELIKCSKNNSKGIYDCDVLLGEIYADGLGVLQNHNKAIHYYTKSVIRGGNPLAAYNVAVLYGEITNTFTNGQRNQLHSNAMKYYAWIKISMALGRSTAIKNDNEVPISIALETTKQFLVNRSLLNEGDALASDICSSIPSCVQ